LLTNLLGAHCFDLILSNYSLPGANGTDLLKACDERDLNTPFAILSGDDDPEIARKVLRRGACAFIPKSLPVKDMTHAIKAVLHGEQFFTKATKRQLNSSPTWPNPKAADEISPLTSIVTERQLDVIQLLSKGYTNKRISQVLNVSVDTVKEHIQNIFLRLDVDNRTLCVIKAKEMGFDLVH